MPDAPKFLPCGDAALTVQFAQAIDADINARVHALDDFLCRSKLAGVRETMPTYGSLLVAYDPGRTSFATLSAQLLPICLELAPRRKIGTNWRVPVVYGGEFGFDLDHAAQHLALDQSEVIARHIASVFTIYMIGFLPGFTYLGGLDPALAIPRHPIPRPTVPAGSIVIGGIQAAIGSIEGPSGWHVIGRTPMRAFMPGREPVVFMKPGDSVHFESWPPTSFAALDAAAGRGDLVAEPMA